MERIYYLVKYKNHLKSCGSTRSGAGDLLMGPRTGDLRGGEGGVLRLLLNQAEGFGCFYGGHAVCCVEFFVGGKQVFFYCDGLNAEGVGDLSIA